MISKACPAREYGHRPEVETISLDSYRDEKNAVCLACGLPIRSFWIDGNEDRAGSWASWHHEVYVIQEIPVG